jgi:hypothetical protein
MSSTYTSPIRIFKRNNPTNDGTIAPDNTGASQCTQQQYITNPITALAAGTTTFTTADVGTTNVVPFVLPAGSSISTVRLYQTATISALTGGVITVAIAITNPTTGAVTTTTIGTITPTSTGGVIVMTTSGGYASAALMNNVGPLDATLTFTAAAVTGTLTGTLGGTFSVEYTPRNPDGSIIAYGAGLSNN